MATLGGLATIADVIVISRQGEAQMNKARVHTLAGFLWAGVGMFLLWKNLNGSLL